LPEGDDAGRSPWLAIGVMLGVLWVAGIATRSVWTPDEPREYALAVNMLHSGQYAVPQLAGQPFAEKPPLTYWASMAAMKLFGTSPIIARLPNLFYGLCTVVCSALLAAFIVPVPKRRTAAALTAIVAGTAWLNYLHTIWLATDAPLLAASALAMLGAWLGPTAATTRLRLIGYALFYLGLTAAFMAKNILGLIAPAMTLGLFILWERRWRALLHWPLWIGLMLSIGAVGAWIHAVSRQPDGSALLRVFLWDNSIGRFFPVATTGDYRTGHLNSPGKLLLEVAVGLLPWLFIASSASWLALRTAFKAVGENRSVARFLVVATWPLLLLLSCSSTVRDVYALPSMIAFSAVIGWSWAQRESASTPTRWTLRIGGAFFWILALLIPTLANGSPFNGMVSFLGILSIALLLAWAARLLRNITVLTQGLAVFTSGLTAFLVLASPIIERGQDLSSVAHRASALAAARPILLTSRDETMAAALDYTGGRHALLTSDFAAAARAQPQALALIESDSDRLTGAMRARLARLSPRLRDLMPAKPEPAALALISADWKLFADLPNEGGRHYQLLLPPALSP
jgi:4-amino-4-deoxy-L-arabinose transferase-like glycosyltransferase